MATASKDTGGGAVLAVDIAEVPAAARASKDTGGGAVLAVDIAEGPAAARASVGLPLPEAASA